MDEMASLYNGDHLPGICSSSRGISAIQPSVSSSSIDKLASPAYDRFGQRVSAY